MRYAIFGPFIIPRNGVLIDRSLKARRKFWLEVEHATSEDLPDACGCYVFAVRASKGIIPWYVGLTEKRTFRKECLGSHQVGNYNDVLAQKEKAQPLLYLLAKQTPKGRNRKPSKTMQRDIQFLESYLIGHGLNKNQKLLNQKKTKFLKSLCVPGILNSDKGHPGKPAKSLRQTLGL